MIFDQPPAELPVATLRPRDSGAQLVLDARGWLAARWQWLRPRAIPVVVAFAGMICVLVSASYLRDLAHRPPEQLPSPVVRAHGHEPANGHEPAIEYRAARPVGAGPFVSRPIIYRVSIPATGATAAAPAAAATR